MILISVVLLWLIMVNILARYQGNSSAGRFYGYLLGRWSPTDGEPRPSQLILALLGRIGFVLLFITLSNLVWRQIWRESIVCLILALVGLATARFWLSDESVLPGLTETKTLLKWSDGYRCLTGRVAGQGPLCGITLADLDLRRRGWLVLAIIRGSLSSQFPKGQEILAGGDQLLIYGCPEETTSKQA